MLEKYREYNKIPKAVFNKMIENFNKDNSKVIEKNFDKIGKCKICFMLEKIQNEIFVIMKYIGKGQKK